MKDISMMNNFGMAMAIGLAIIIVLLLIIVIVLTSGGSKKNKKTKKDLYDTKIPMPTTYELFLPPHIEKIGRSEIDGILKNIFSSYKYFDYKSMGTSELEKKEWHSWQVSLLLLSFKYGEMFTITNQERYFHPFLLKASENDVKSFMNSILRKYKNYVEINKSKDDLCKDYIWSNKDISIIFYFLANYKTYSK